MMFDSTTARNYVKAIDLAHTPRGIVVMGPEAMQVPFLTTQRSRLRS
jgi:hypothetical protein